MSEDREKMTGEGKKSDDRLDSRIIPVMREAVATVQVILFGELKDRLADRFHDMDPVTFRRLIGCIVSDLFGTPARDSESVAFARSNMDVVERELWAIKNAVPELLPILTDALRMQTLCDHEEGINSLPTLLRAREFGVLQQERAVPMPSTFMIAVRQLGATHGLLRPMEMDDPASE